MRTSLVLAEQHRSLAPDRIHHRSDIVHALLERGQLRTGHAVGQAGSPLVEDDHATERGQPFEDP